MGADIYPSLQHCKDYEGNMDMCPWSRPREDYCGFGKDNLLNAQYGYQAVWRITPLKLNDRKFIIQSSAHGVRDQDGQLSFECLAFEKNGAATNPSRYNWGNGDAWCGAGDWEGQGKDIALLNNKQAVFIIIARK